MADLTPVTNETLVKLYEDGYNKSIITITDDIMKEYMARLKSGTKLFRYLKCWSNDYSFMSPVYTQGDNMKKEANTTLQSNCDVEQFEIAVISQLIKLYGVYIHSSDIKYVDNKTGWHHMKFDIVLSLEPKKE